MSAFTSRPRLALSFLSIPGCPCIVFTGGKEDSFEGFPLRKFHTLVYGIGSALLPGVGSPFPDLEFPNWDKRALPPNRKYLHRYSMSHNATLKGNFTPHLLTYSTVFRGSQFFRGKCTLHSDPLGRKQKRKSKNPLLMVVTTI